MPRDRFRRENPLNLRDGDLIRFRRRESTRSGRMRFAVVVGRIKHIEKDPADGWPRGEVVSADGETHRFKFGQRDKVSRRLASFEELISPEPLPREVTVNQDVAGYHVKVGSGQQTWWVHRTETGYDVDFDPPAEPPFADQSEALAARTWVEQAYPGTVSVSEHVYGPAGQDQSTRSRTPLGRRPEAVTPKPD